MLIKFIAIVIGLPVIGLSLAITIAFIRYGFRVNMETKEDPYDRLDADYEEYLKEKKTGLTIVRLFILYLDLLGSLKKTAHSGSCHSKNT